MRPWAISYEPLEHKLIFIPAWKGQSIIHTNPGSVKRFVIHDLTGEVAANTFAEDVRTGLTSSPKRLLPKYFYDELGSLLFEAVCFTPEYYLTRSETEILKSYAGEIIDLALGFVGPDHKAQRCRPVG